MIIVTGGAGYIGSELAEALSNATIPHKAIDKQSGVGKDHIVLDLRDKQKIKNLVKNFKPTVVVHAGTHSALAYRDAFQQSFEEDLRALESLLAALKEFPRTRLFYFSSNYVYSGSRKKQSVKEEDPLLPVHNFGVGKSFFEQYILRNHGESVIFRLSSVFGKGPTQHPNALFNLANEAKTTGQVTVWGKGRRMMQYVYLPDVVRLVSKAFDAPWGIYNLGGNEYVSLKDTAHAVANLFNAKSVFLRDKPEGETLPRMDTRKVRALFSAGAFTPFQKALKEYLLS